MGFLRLQAEEDVKDVVRMVRQKVATDRLKRPPESVEESSEVLYGQCVENARKLAQQLAAETDASVKIVEGGLDLRGEPTPANYEQAQSHGTVHHWVLATLDTGQTFHCNLAKESFSRPTGEILVSPHQPRVYIDFGRRVHVEP